nr:hypothetical protein CFP56_72685 [Quercus suber]
MSGQKVKVRLSQLLVRCGSQRSWPPARSGGGSGLREDARAFILPRGGWRGFLIKSSKSRWKDRTAFSMSDKTKGRGEGEESRSGRFEWRRGWDEEIPSGAISSNDASSPDLFLLFMISRRQGL